MAFAKASYCVSAQAISANTRPTPQYAAKMRRTMVSLSIIAVACASVHRSSSSVIALVSAA